MFDFVAFIPRAISQSILFCTAAPVRPFPEKGGNLNLGIPGVMYVGAISGVIALLLL